MIAGWLFDLYPHGGDMACWMRQEDGRALRVTDGWTHSIYVAADDKADLKSVPERNDVRELVKGHEFVDRRERITDADKSTVLRLFLADSARAAALAGRIERLGRFGRFRLYNVDVPPAQAYMYERHLFSLLYGNVSERNSRLRWCVDDDVWQTEYLLPAFKKVRLNVDVCKKGRLPKFTDKIGSISIDAGNEVVGIEGSEPDILAGLNSEVARIDPDFIMTSGGDSFLFPYLIHRAEQSGTAITLGREPEPPARPARDGTSYFSYGKIHFKPSAIKLKGRIHIDVDTSNICSVAQMEGLYEVARTCRMPLHTAARASIGKCMSSLQFYHATKEGILIPWKPVLAEHFKTYQELLVADRGGFVFEPEVGVHERVAEFDFASLYPNIMMKKNLSAETVRCGCCPGSKEQVPELGYNICEKRKGIVPVSLEILVGKRAMYKKLRNSATDADRRRVYDERQNALKWILVTSFGYLGFNNAKFGRIDAHIAVCAFDRQIFLQSSRIAERIGFRVLHGIVDSLWVQKRNATKEDYVELKEAIEKETGFEISFEGVYRWIAFLHSRVDSSLPVANRYFGVFEDGAVKVRGIEARRHDTPPLLARFQHEILGIMARGNSVREVKALMPEVDHVFQKYASLLESGSVPLDDLAFTKQTSKDTGQYRGRNTVENSALGQLASEGRLLKAGQTLHYIITGYRKKSGRAVPVEMANESTRYDAKRYVELLAEACNSVTEPFGHVVTSSQRKWDP